jgi:acyl carrier protein
MIGIDKGGFMTSIEERVINCITEQLGIGAEAVKPEATFEELNADSLDLVELVMCLEEEFDVEIPDEDAEKLSTVKDAITYVTAKVEGK